MEIKDIQPGMGKVEIILEIIDKGTIREFEKFGKTGKVCTATGKDKTGKIKISLWNEDVDKVTKGAQIKIENGYVNEYQGELQLTTGKFGKLEILKEGEKEPKQEKIETLTTLTTPDTQETITKTSQKEEFEENNTEEETNKKKEELPEEPIEELPEEPIIEEELVE